MFSLPIAANGKLFTLRGRAKFAARKALSWVGLLTLLTGGATVTQAQFALDGFDPNPTNFLGEIVAVAVQPDGKILIGGNFTALAPNEGPLVGRNHIARLNPDGTLDLSFDPNINGSVFSILTQPDGKILVGGPFTRVGDQTRNYIARLDGATGAPDSFNPNASNTVGLITLHAGRILVAGDFTRIGGKLRSRMARLDPVTGLADAFDPNPNNIITSVAVQPDGKILVGGCFSSILGQTRNSIARIDPTTGLADSFDPNANGCVGSIALQPDGKIVVGGGFTKIGGQNRNNLARIDPTTGLADSFNPNSDNSVLSVLVQANGNILVRGRFANIGGQMRSLVASLNPITGLADSLNPEVKNQPHLGYLPTVNGIALQPDGKILIAGFFDLVNAKQRSMIARLETDGTLDQTLKAGVAGGSVLTTVFESDGKTLLGGNFTSVLSMTRNRIARLTHDGTLDSGFNPNANDVVNALAVQPDGKILAAGGFTQIGNQPRNRIARLDSTTGLSDSFDPNANAPLSAIALQRDGKILVAGSFTNIGGQTRNYLARIDPVTGLADSFDPNANDLVNSVAIQADGKILVAGLFTAVGGQMRNHIARLDATNGLADSFNPDANDVVRSLAVQGDGRILTGGLFTSIGGQKRNRVARLDTMSGLADLFNPNADNAVNSITIQANGNVLLGGSFLNIDGQMRNRIARLDSSHGLPDSLDPNANGDAYSIALQPDGKIMTGGAFNQVGGQSRDALARLSNDTASMQDLFVTPSSIVWTLAGSSPQLARATFEYAPDDVNYAFLGHAAPAGNSWILNGLNLPDGPNFYIRAQGYYRTGYLNGSESTMVRVKYGPATLTPMPSATPTSTPGQTASPSPIPTPQPIPTEPPGLPFCDGPIYLQYFDSVTPPALPEGWVSSFISGPGTCQPGGACTQGTQWVTDTTSPNTAPNSAFHNAPGCVTDSFLDASIFVPAAIPTTLSFRHYYNLEDGFDGAVLEASIEGAPFVDMITLLGGIFTGEYDGTISPDFLSPIAGRRAWTGNSNGYRITSFSLPGSFVGHNVVFRFRLATDCSVSGGGWRIDTLRITAPLPCQTPTPTPTPSPTPTIPPTVCTLTAGFDNLTTLTPDGWFTRNNSSPSGSTGWFQGDAATFTSHSGASNSYIAADFRNGNNLATISDWLLTPPILLQNGAQLSFWTRTLDSPNFPDRLQVRMSMGGTSTDVGNTATSVGAFTVLMDINPTYTLSGYPSTWTNFVVTLSGIVSPIKGRLAFRYFVENGGPSGPNSDYIGIDTVQYDCNGLGQSTPTPTPTPVIPTPTPTHIRFVSRLSDARASAGNLSQQDNPPPVIQTDFSPANLSNSAVVGAESGCATARSASISSIAFDNSNGTVLVTGNGTAETTAIVWASATASTKIIHLSFTVADFPYSYSLTGQLSADSFSASNCAFSPPGVLENREALRIAPPEQFTGATARLSQGDSAIFEVSAPPAATLSQTGTLPPGDYTISVDLNASSSSWSTYESTGTFTFALNPAPTPTPTPTASATATATPTPTPSGTPTPTPGGVAQASNLSTRLLVGMGDSAGIGGFIVTGNAPKNVLLRGIGPSLGSSGALNSLADPFLELHGNSGFATITNNNWRETQETEIIATGIPPSDDLESAIIATLAPGAYTAILTGHNGGTGVGLVEIYDLSQGNGSKLANLSTRAAVGTGNDVVIAGFILGGGSSDDLILLRGIGPSLAQSGVTNPLANPALELRNSDGAVIASNDDWQNGPLISLPPSDPLESVIEATLPPGAYTALLSGVNNGTGIGLVEVYDHGSP